MSTPQMIDLGPRNGTLRILAKISKNRRKAVPFVLHGLLRRRLLILGQLTVWLSDSMLSISIRSNVAESVRWQAISCRVVKALITKIENLHLYHRFSLACATRELFFKQ